MNKRLILLLLLIIGTSINLSSQSFDPFVEEIISKVNIDSLVKHVSAISGGDSVIVDGSKVLIDERTSEAKRVLAGKYIQSQFQAYGLPTLIQDFSLDTLNGHNVIARQEGSIHPDSIIIICAHYDTYEFSPGADDNASGVAAVLETARLLSKHELNYTILYCLWDLEELGLIGSGYFTHSEENLAGIAGVFNIEMLGYDGNDDFYTDVHTMPVANSVEMAEAFKRNTELYGINTVIEIVNPGTDRSDHANFWYKNIAAVVFSQDFLPDGEDFTPYYHTEDDIISYFDLEFYHENAKAATGFVAAMAQKDMFSTSVNEALLVKDYNLYQNYPNPFNPSTVIGFNLPAPGFVKLKIFNVLGEELKVLVNREMPSGYHSISFNAEGLPSGTYIYELSAGNRTESKKMILLQ